MLLRLSRTNFLEKERPFICLYLSLYLSGALIWLKALYGADFKKVKLSRTYKTDLKTIAEKLVKYSDRFVEK